MQIALANGVPLVVAGVTEDKAEVSARVQWSGAGINLKTSTPTAEQMLKAVKTLLAEPSYKQKALALKAAMAQTDAANTAADLIEGLVKEAGQPKPMVEELREAVLV